MTDLRALSPHAFLRAGELLAVAAETLFAAEALRQPRLFSPRGLLSWTPLAPASQRHAWFLRRTGLLPLLASERAVMFLLGARLCLGMGVLALILLGRSDAAALLLLCLLTWLWQLRAHGILEGASLFATVCLTAATGAECLGTQTAAAIALVFLAAQSSLAYGTAGFLKLRLRHWRDGSAVRHIVSSARFGHPGLSGWMQRHPPLTRLSGFIVVLSECLLMFAALLPLPVCVGLLLLGVLFHLGVAFVLRLNGFVWAYPSAYPAVLWVCLRLHARK